MSDNVDKPGDILDSVSLSWVREHAIQAHELIGLLQVEVGLARCDLAAFKAGLYKVDKPIERIVERPVPVYEPDPAIRALIDAAAEWANADQLWEKRDYQYEHGVMSRETGKLIDEEDVRRAANAAERAGKALRKAVEAWREKRK
jgi:hypothetical protein